MSGKLCIGFAPNVTGIRGGPAARRTHSSLSLLQHCLGANECFLGRAGRVDFRPFDVAEVEFLLPARNDCVRVRSVARTVAYAGEARLEFRSQENALECVWGDFRDFG